MTDIEAIKARHQKWEDFRPAVIDWPDLVGMDAHHDRATLLSALSAAEARAEAAEAMLLVFMAAPPDFTVDQARAAIAALRQRAAMDDLLRMDGELYDVPEAEG